jgi:simple sugar transport system permease protein
MNIYLAALRTAIDAGTVVVLAGMGELLAERVGVLDLGLEGLIGMGAVAAVITASHVSWTTSSAADAVCTNVRATRRSAPS